MTSHLRIPKGQGYRVRRGRWHVYTAYDEAGTALYVGITRCLHQRIASHIRSPWFDRAARIGVRHFDDLQEAIRAELEAIARLDPPHNKRRIPYLDDFPDTPRHEPEIRFIGVADEALRADPPRRTGRPRQAAPAP